MRCTIALLICLLATASGIILDCSPGQLEIEFQITTLVNNTYLSGIGKLHIDSKVRNVTVMNITRISELATETELYITDLNRNVSYLLKPATGECSVQNESYGVVIFILTGSVYLGSGEERLEANIFEGTANRVKTTLVATKNQCIPIHVVSRCDTSLHAFNFFNATIGIKNPDILRIPDKCRTLS